MMVVGFLDQILRNELKFCLLSAVNITSYDARFGLNLLKPIGIAF